MKNAKTELEHRMKYLGALQIVEDMQRTCNMLYQEFGAEIFPHGVPILTRPQPQSRKLDKAQRLIDGAEALRQKHGKTQRKPKKRRGPSQFTGYPRPPKDYRSPTDSPGITMREAAELAGVSPSYIRMLVKTGHISKTGNNEYGIHLVSRSDVLAWMARRAAKESQGEPNATERLQDQGQPVSA